MEGDLLGYIGYTGLHRVTQGYIYIGLYRSYTGLHMRSHRMEYDLEEIHQLRGGDLCFDVLKPLSDRHTPLSQARVMLRGDPIRGSGWR